MARDATQGGQWGPGPAFERKDQPDRRFLSYLEDLEETVAVGDFEVALCRVGEYGDGPDPAAPYRLVAMAGSHWYVVGLETTLRHARELAGQLERPCGRTHRLAMSRETRTASLTPELFRLTGRTSVTLSFLKVRWAPPGSGFEVGAEYDSPLDERHPRWVGEADLAADAERRAQIYPLWHARAVDMDELAYEVYPDLTDRDPRAKSAHRM